MTESTFCRQIRDKIAEQGIEGLRHDAPAQTHLADCEGCSSFVGRLAELERDLEALPMHDAPDALVEKLLAREELSTPAAKPVRHALPGSILRVAGLAAALLVLASSVMFLSRPPAPSMRSEIDVADLQQNARTAEEYRRSLEVQERIARGEAEGAEGWAVGPGSAGGFGGGNVASRPPPPPSSPRAEIVGGEAEGIDQDAAGPGVGGGAGGGRVASDQPVPEPVPRDNERSDGRRSPPRVAEPEPEASYPRSRRELTPQEVDAVADAEKQLADPDPSAFGDYRQQAKEDAGTFALEGALDEKKTEDFEKSGDAFANERVADLDAQTRDGLASLAFREASGYWSNTYVPGDPVLRFLAARLRELGPQPPYVGLSAPHADVRRVEQPFDAPETNALSVFLAADRRAVTDVEPTRLTLQVGLQAMARQASRRPAMNLAVVLDATEETPLEAVHGLAALLRELDHSREIGDTFHYVLAGAAPPELELPADVLATGTVTDALVEGVARVAGAEDPSTVLGANAVLLVTGRVLGAEVERLERIAHRSAVGGVPVSVVALGTGTATGELERLALAGQGGRRLVAQPSDAASVVEAELTAASRVVARAVRLRIRLAPGVQLVDVLGSRRLDTLEADRVREAEQAIDQRLVRSLGIASDRGEDEEGIQIVIPSFYAGDSHVILLDVVANEPGAVADVTARYKDVGSLTNEIARARLTLERGERTRTALEANVEKNLLAFRLSESLDDAGEALARGDQSGAAARLSETRSLLETARSEHPQLDDPGVRADIALLDRYLTLLGGGVVGNPTVRDYVSASLRFASRLKLTSRLALD